MSKARLSTCMLISHRGHTDTIHVYSVTLMTHVKALQAGHSSQGTSEPITLVTIPAWTKGQLLVAPTFYYWTTTGTVTILISESDLCGSDDLPITCSVSKGDVWVSVSWISAWPICIYGREAYLLGRLRPPPPVFFR